MLKTIALLQDRNSDDVERYLKMGLRLDPNDAGTNFRNEKDAMLLFTSETLRIIASVRK